MQRRSFLGTLAVAGTTVLGWVQGCAVSRISDEARDPEQGDPWRCQTCGYLTRSSEDISGKWCPRCMTKRFKRVTEDEFAKWLAA